MKRLATGRQRFGEKSLKRVFSQVQFVLLFKRVGNEITNYPGDLEHGPTSTTLRPSFLASFLLKPFYTGKRWSFFTLSTPHERCGFKRQDEEKQNRLKGIHNLPSSTKLTHLTLSLQLLCPSFSAMKTRIKMLH